MIEWWFDGDSMGFNGDVMVIWWWFHGDSMVIWWWFNGHLKVIWRWFNGIQWWLIGDLVVFQWGFIGGLMLISWWFNGDLMVIQWWFEGGLTVIQWDSMVTYGWFSGDSMVVYWWFDGDSMVIYWWFNGGLMWFDVTYWVIYSIFLIMVIYLVNSMDGIRWFYGIDLYLFIGFFFGFHEIQWWFSGGNECVSDSMVFFLVDCMVILSAISWFSRWCSLRCCNRTWQWEIPWWMGIEKWEYHLTGWWFQTCFLFSIIYGNNHPNWLRFFNWNIIYLLVNVYRKLWNISVFKFGKSTISMGHFQ